MFTLNTNTACWFPAALTGGKKPFCIYDLQPALALEQVTEHYELRIFLSPSFFFLLTLNAEVGYLYPFNRIYIYSNRIGAFLPTEEASSSAHSAGLQSDYEAWVLCTPHKHIQALTKDMLQCCSTGRVEMVTVPSHLSDDKVSLTSSPAFISVRSLWPFLKLSNITETNTRTHTRTHFIGSAEHISTCRNSTFHWRTHF